MEALTDELVEVITNYSPIRDRSRFTACKTAATKNLRYHQYPRTNQFEVRNSLEGLIEKFQVLNNDALAAELEQRLHELKIRSNKWTPEVLSLLLLLSNDPLNQTKLESLTQLRPPEPASSLTWAEVLADDPILEDGIWDDVDFRVGSDDEDTTLQSVLSPRLSEETRRSSITEDDAHITATTFVLPVQKTALGAIAATYNVTTRDMTEVQMIRETLHMLLGLPTKLYERHRSDGHWVVRTDASLERLSRTSLHDLLESFAAMGNDLAVIRDFCATKPLVPLLQTYKSCTQNTLYIIERSIGEKETELVDLKTSRVISLIELEASVPELHKRLVDFKDNIQFAQSISPDEAYLLLDKVFNQVSLAQTVGDETAFIEIGNVFCHCLQTYLKPLRVWLEEGVVEPGTITLPFISRQGVGISTFWQDRYALALDRNGKIKAPRFLQDLMPRIFSSGKGVAFMHELGLSSSLARNATQETVSMRQLDFASIIGQAHEPLLLPFSDLLRSALENWVVTKAHTTWLVLRRQLFAKGGLRDTLHALEHVYLCRDGSITNSFIHRIFSKLDAGRRTWKDSYVLQDTARQCFGPTRAVDPGKIVRVRFSSNTSASSRRDRTVKSLEAIFRSTIYDYPKHIHNIIPPSTALSIYQAAATLLVQLYRPLYLLTQPRFITVRAAAVPQSALRLRYMLMQTLTVIRGHLLKTTISIPSRILEGAIAAADSIDGLIAAHAAFMSTLERGCLLVKAMDGVKSAVLSLADLAVLFAELWDRYLSGPKSQSAREEPDAEDDSEDDSDDEEERIEDSSKTKDELSTAPISPLSPAEFERRAKQMQTQHDQLVGFVVTGSRTAARSKDGDLSWNVLAEVLTWSTGSAGNI